MRRRYSAQGVPGTSKLPRSEAVTAGATEVTRSTQSEGGLGTDAGRFGLGVVVAAMSGLLVWSRAANLGTSFWNDEAYSAWMYIDRGPRGIFRNSSYIPNNHVLFSVLSWPTTSIVGRNEAVYRLWSVVPALAAVAVAAWWAWRTFSPVVGAFVLTLSAISPLHLVLAPQARGYGLAMLAGILMLIGAVMTQQGRRRNGLVLLACGGIVGICAMPVVVLGYAAHAGILLTRRALRRSVLLTTAAVGTISLLFLAPLLTAILHNSSQQYGVQLSWDGLLVGPYNQLVKPQIVVLSPGASTSISPRTSTAANVVILAIAFALFCAAISALFRRGEGVIALHLTIPIVFTYLVLTIFRIYVAPRFMSFLLFNVITLLALGAGEVWRLVSSRAVLAFIFVLLVTVGVLFGARRVVDETRAQTALPWENARAVREISHRTKIKQLVTNATDPYSLYYYVGRNNVRLLSTQQIAAQTYCSQPAPFLLVNQTNAGAQRLDLSCLRSRGAVRIRVRQQTYSSPIGTRGAFDVWVVARPQP